MLNLMKNWKGTEKEEWAKNQVEKSLLVFSCHRIQFYFFLSSNVFFANSIYSCFKRVPTYQAHQVRQACHQSLPRHPFGIW